MQFNPICIRHDQILDTLCTFIWWKDMEGRYLGANQHTLKRLGLTEAELIGKTVFDILSKEEALQITLNDQEVLRTRQPKTFHEVFDGPGGMEKPILSISPLCLMTTPISLE